MRRRLLGAGVLAVASGIALAAFSAGGLWVAAQPAGGPSQVLEIHDGDSLATVARRLEEAGLLPQRPLFGPAVLIAYGRLARLDRQIKSGEYDIDSGRTPIEILYDLARGTIKTHAVTLPEGLRLDEIAERLEAAGIVASGSFLERARDRDVAGFFGIDAPSLEGYLYPETYRFRRDSLPEEVLHRMVEEFRSRWTEADHQKLGASEMNLHEVVTLASIVEKESSVPKERRLIAAVFLNRLERRMRLQSDPTVIYGIIHTHGSFGGNIRQNDLQIDNVYNTYTRRGLPPSPIASTTIESIRAVLDPEQAPYLYFVSRNDGTHEFSRTLKEHNRAVYRYQKGGRQRSGSS